MSEPSSYSPEMLQRYKSIFGGKFGAFLESSQKRQPKSIRVNLLKTTVEKLTSSLTKQGFILRPVSWCPEGFFVVKSPQNLAATMEHLLGHFFIMDAASMAVAIELSPNQRDVVLDMAAAPGGKTVHLAQVMNNKGTIVAIDSDPERIKAVVSNVERCGAENTIVMTLSALDSQKLGKTFDKILLDAPCTGEGVVRKDPKKKAEICEADFLECASLQKEMLGAAHSVLNKGGVLLYSTCSMAPEEDEMVIEWAVDTLGFEILPLVNKYVSPGMDVFFNNTHPAYLKQCGRFYPHIHNTQGFFMAKLKKK